MTRNHLCFVVESGTDVRLVEGLAARFPLTVIARHTLDGAEISQQPSCELRLQLGPPSRIDFARYVIQQLLEHRHQFTSVLVQGYSLAALAANLVHRYTATPTAMLVCSPLEAYYECRAAHPPVGKPFRRRERYALEALARLNAALGNRYITLSRYLAKLMRQRTSIKPIDVIPVYGVDTSVFRPFDEPKSTLRQRLGLPETGELIFFSSRIAPEKDAATLLRAVRQLRHRGRNVWLVNYGGGHRQLTIEAHRFGIGERVIARDALHPYKELPAAYNAADVCVQASREEGLGFSVLEAMACEVPVIAANVGGLRDIIDAGRTGWHYPVGDANALARRLAHVLKAHEEVREVCRAARAFVIDHFEEHLVFDQLAELFDRALGGHVQPASPSPLSDARAPAQ